MVFGAIECPPRPIYLAAPKFASHVAQANLPNLALFQRIFSGWEVCRAIPWTAENQPNLIVWKVTIGLPLEKETKRNYGIPFIRLPNKKKNKKIILPNRTLIAAVSHEVIWQPGKQDGKYLYSSTAYIGGDPVQMFWCCAVYILLSGWP